LFELLAFIRSAAFAVIFGGIEYRYVNYREEGWTTDGWNFKEKPVFGQYTPYHVFFVMPLFIAVGFTLPLTAWIGDALLIALVEDISYFAWRGRWVEKGEWTTKLYGSIGIGRRAIPLWWLAFFFLVSLFYLAPF
jgi:hypothetical protein